MGWTFIKQPSWSRSWFDRQVGDGIHPGDESETILQFFAGLRGTLAVTFEEGTWSAWLYDLLHSRVDKLLVCNPRKNGLLKDGNKSDRIDARKLAELLHGNQLKPVYHGETGVRMLRELSRSYLTVVKDLSRVTGRGRKRKTRKDQESRSDPSLSFLANGDRAVLASKKAPLTAPGRSEHPPT